ncbi:SUI1 family translation initiation factor [Flexilinea flocculi]|jgi:translation initiation factor 1|uniref:Translation initiation factor 1 n=1 Tax=Flexilinea flocculi TaxID=1678840 RepID=A0A0S7BM80_9CHLR|nr:translation initiation factor [Flexilinea flocculi]NMB93325.1 translation initiation factor [Flexilinea flocculi]GAP41389.1 translation initiation factor 1 [Flexilinea flocculi]
MKRNENPVVFSTESGRICPNCGFPKQSCICKNSKTASAASFPDGIIRVRREKQGRAGKEVSIIRGISGSLKDLQIHAGNIKKQCGAGGSIKDGEIIIQGDHIEFIMNYFTKLGMKIKKDGG